MYTTGLGSVRARTWAGRASSVWSGLGWPGLAWSGLSRNLAPFTVPAAKQQHKAMGKKEKHQPNTNTYRKVNKLERDKLTAGGIAGGLAWGFLTAKELPSRVEKTGRKASWFFWGENADS